MIAISVIICAHNPRLNYLGRALQALREQTLPLHEWELLLVDNASEEPLAKQVDLAWHRNARHIREMSLGLTPARLRGIAEAKGGLLVFVDDDNVLSHDYLEHVVTIGSEHPQLGAWSGNVRLEFEQPPPQWTKPYWSLLAAREVSHDVIARSDFYQAASTPVGAGMCLRREVGVFYRDHLLKSPIRQSLGRRGQALTSGEDTDMALTACDMGLENGMFARLALIHLIPPHRLLEEYLLRLRSGVAMSSLLLQLLRGRGPRRVPRGLRWWLRFIYDCTRKWGRKRRFYLAEVRGKRDACRVFADLIAAEQGSISSTQRPQPVKGSPRQGI